MKTENTYSHICVSMNTKINTNRPPTNAIPTSIMETGNGATTHRRSMLGEKPSGTDNFCKKEEL